MNMFGSSVQQRDPASNPVMTVGPGRRALVSVIGDRDVLGPDRKQQEGLHDRTLRD